MSLAPEIAAPEIVTLENLRRVTRERALGYGITLIAIGLLEVLWFGAANSALQTTIELGYNSSSACRNHKCREGHPSSHRTPLARSRGLEARPCLRPGAHQVHERRAQLPRHRWRLSHRVAGRLVARRQQRRALRTMTIPDSATGYVVGIITTVAGGFSRGDDSTAAPHPSSTPASCSSCSDFSSGLRAGPTCRACICSSPDSRCVRGGRHVLIFGSLSGTLCERSGVVNIAIEGSS